MGYPWKTSQLQNVAAAHDVREAKAADGSATVARQDCSNMQQPALKSSSLLHCPPRLLSCSFLLAVGVPRYQSTSMPKTTVKHSTNLLSKT